MKKILYATLLLLALLALTGCPGGGGGLKFFPPGGGGGGESGASPTSYSIGGTVTGLGGAQTVTVQLNGGETKLVSANTAFQFDGQVASGGTYNVQVKSTTGGTNCMAAQNQGVALGSSITNIKVVCSATTHTLTANVSGLTGSVILQNNFGDDLTVKANGTSPFATMVPSGSGYWVTVKQQPTGLTCTPTSNIGTMSADVTVNVSCSATTYSISGKYTALNGTGLKLRLLETGEELVLSNSPPASPSGATDFTFTQKLADGSSYHVVVGQNPANLVQTCSPTNGNGTLSGSDITNVSITCVTSQFSIGGSVTGLGNTEQVTLRVNGGSDLVVTGGGTATDAINPPWNLTDGSLYNITVATNPAHKTCSVTHGSGRLAGANITNVQVDCAYNKYTVGGQVNGLCSGQTITVRNNGGSEILVSGSSPIFTFPSQNDLSAYAVTFVSPPAGVSCSVSNGSGNLNAANVTNVSINCTGCASCNGSGSITVKWQASRSFDVNDASGGGHRVYYQTTSGVTKSTPTYVDVPNSTNKTQVTIPGLKQGCTYYVKVGGYSFINPTGGNLSGQMSVSIP